VPVKGGLRAGIIGVVQLINKTDKGVLTPCVNVASSGRCEFTVGDMQFLQVLALQAGSAIANHGMIEQRQAEYAECGRRSCSPDMHLSKVLSNAPIRGRKSSKGSCAEDARSSPMPLANVKPLLAAAYNSWEMDTLSLAELTGNKPLSVLATYLFEELGLTSTFCLDRTKLQRFLCVIESGYPDSNPYHNKAHGASVLHLTHMLLLHAKVAEAASAALAPPEASGGLVGDSNRHCQLVTLAGLLAAVTHDYEHPGLSNGFLVNTSSPKAIRYNDKSPNENHHVAAAFEVLQRPECNFLEHLDAKEFKMLRGLIVDLVLSTDMAESGKLSKSFQDMVGHESTPEGSRSSKASAFAPISAQHALLVLQMALKCADVGHLTLGWNAHIRWVQRLESEFFAQGDQEKKRGLPEVSFLMDRGKPGVSQTQVGFFEFVALPLFRSFVRAFPAASPMLLGLQANYEHWRTIAAEVEVHPIN
jgi:hypothetical protein